MKVGLNFCRWKKCTLKNNLNILLQLGNNIHKYFEFTMETKDAKHQLSFLDMAVYVDEKNSSKWYQRPTDTVTILHFCSCALVNKTETEKESTIYRPFRSTSNFNPMNRAENQEICRAKNQHPIMVVMNFWIRHFENFNCSKKTAKQQRSLN